MSRYQTRTMGALAWGALLFVAACHRASTGPGDSGPNPVIIVPDSGMITGHHDAGYQDSGVVIFPDSGQVPLKLLLAAPNAGPVAGGTPVNLSGVGFQSGLVPGDPGQATQVTAVTFGGNPALSLTILSDDTIQVVSPAGAAGAADVVITNPNGQATCAGCFTFQPPVELLSVSPARGPITGATPITVTGLGFDKSTIVLIGGHEALSITLDPLTPASKLTAITPATSFGGPVDVRLFNTNGVASLHGAFTYYEPLALTSVAPAGGPLAGGTVLTLTGSGFAGPTLSLTVGGVAVSGLTAVDDFTVTATAPASTKTGPVDVTLSDSDGAVTLTGGFVYYDPSQTQLALLGVEPRTGSTLGGTAVTLVGNGFSQPGTPSVTFGVAPATAVAVVNDNLLTAVTPAGSGPVTVAVTLASNTAILPAAFTYELVPAVSSISPSSGPTSGGTSITVTGSGFASGDLLYIGALQATNVTVFNASRLVATTPAGTAGPNDVRVVSAVDSRLVGVLAGGFTYQDAFKLVQLSPNSGAQAGGTYVLLLGTEMQPGTSVSFGGAPATDVQLIDPYTLSCHTPPGNAGPVDVTATAPSSSASSSTLHGGFSYFDPSNTQGGSSGGPLDGTLNVTVLDNDFNSLDKPIPGVTVQLGVDPHTPFQGVTDARGQITFSDPTLVKAQTVTASFGLQSITVDGVTRQNLTLFLTVPMGGGGGGMLCPCAPPGQAPNCPKYCNLEYCTPLGCVQCMTNQDCQNPALPSYTSTTPYCLNNFCVTCTKDSDCTNDPNGNYACDTNRGNQSTFTCVQCNQDSFCQPPNYCNQQADICEPADIISGNVYGFKLPPSVVLGSTQVEEVHVGIASASFLSPGSSVYYFEPFGTGGEVCSQSAPGTFCEHVLTQDGDAFNFVFDTGAQEVTIYAKFGVADYAFTPPTFTPYLLGLARKISVDPQHSATGIALILDTPLDQSAPITLQNQLGAPPPLFVGSSGTLLTDPNPVQYDTYAYLDLGQDGIVPLNHAVSGGTQVTVDGLPQVQGNGVLFMTQAFQDPPAGSGQTFSDPSMRFPTSNFFRRVQTDFTSGVPMGPLLAFADPLHPAVGGALDGTFSWSFQGSTPPVGPPDITQIVLFWYWIQNGHLVAGPAALWQIVVSGSQTQVQIPPDMLASALLAITPSDNSIQLGLAWVIQTAHAPRFDFNFWSYQDLNNLDWTSFQFTQIATHP